MNVEKPSGEPAVALAAKPVGRVARGRARLSCWTCPQASAPRARPTGSACVTVVTTLVTSGDEVTLNDPAIREAKRRPITLSCVGGTQCACLSAPHMCLVWWHGLLTDGRVTCVHLRANATDGVAVKVTGRVGGERPCR